MNKAGTLVEKIYRDPEFAASIAEDIFPMAISYEQGKFLSRAVGRYKPRLFVELGFRYGISSLWIQSAVPPPGQHIIIDPYHHIPHPPRKYTIDDFMKKQKNVTLVERMTSQEYLAELLHKKEKVDMVFVDASQWFDSIMTDMYFISRIVRVGGRVVIRNIWSRPIRKALMFYIKNLSFALEGFAPWEIWAVKHIPVVGELLLRVKIRPLGLAVLRLTAPDTRDWNHYVPF